MYLVPQLTTYKTQQKHEKNSQNYRLRDSYFIFL